VKKCIGAFLICLGAVIGILYLDSAHHDGCASVLRSCDPFEVFGYPPDLVALALIGAAAIFAVVAVARYKPHASK